MKRFISSIIVFSVFFTASLFFTLVVNAKEVTVKNNSEVIKALEQLSEDTTILYDKDFENENFAEISISHYTDHKVIIDGNGLNLKTRFNVNLNQNRELTIQNVNFNNQEFQSPEKSVGISIALNSEAKLKLKDIKFQRLVYENNSKSPIDVVGNRGAVEAMNILMKEITSNSIALFKVDNPKMKIIIKNSTFKNNLNYEGVVFSWTPSRYNVDEEGGNIEIYNSVFSENTTQRKSAWFDKAAAISINGGKNKVVVKNSYFNKNKFISIEKYYNAGAISVNSAKTITIDGSTFEDNEGQGSGAINIYKRPYDNQELIFENNTFFKNKGNGNHLLKISGAININQSLFIDPPDEFDYNEKITLKSRNNTFYGNIVDGTNNPNGKWAVGGVAYGGLGAIKSFETTNDTFVGNKVISDSSNVKEIENVDLIVGDVDVENSLGYDNGKVAKETVEEVFGKYPAIIGENGGKVKAGISSDLITIPTVNIAPRIMKGNEMITGIANTKATNATEYDQRGYKRKELADIGAVEISSLLYDANGGKFTLAELSKYDGKTYYDGKNPAQYAKVGNPGSEYTIINGKTVLKPVKAGKVFLGWSDVKNDKVAKLKFVAGKKVSVDDQKVLYAVWKDETYALKYYNNGKTTGTIPTQKKVSTGTTITIKSQGKLKRKGYKFSGWSTKPSAKKGEAAYAPGKKLKLVKNTKLYAIWKR